MCLAITTSPILSPDIQSKTLQKRMWSICNQCTSAIRSHLICRFVVQPCTEALSISTRSERNAASPDASFHKSICVRFSCGCRDSVVAVDTINGQYFSSLTPLQSSIFSYLHIQFAERALPMWAILIRNLAPAVSVWATIISHLSSPPSGTISFWFSAQVGFRRTYRQTQ